MAFNSDAFNLSNWKLTLPVDSANGIDGTAVEIKNLAGYENANYFYDATDGAMVFRASVDGATTSGSKYARSELREMNGTDKAAWTLAEGGTMTATLEVDSVPIRTDGSSGRIVIGQIHGQSDELVRLYWENGSIHLVNDRAGSSDAETTFLLKNAAGETPSIGQNEKFSYKIDAHDDRLTVEVHADGDVYASTTRINSVWQSDTLYFKAGVYLGVNETQGAGVGQTSFYGLDFSHQAGKGLGGLINGPTSPSVPTVPSMPVTPTEPGAPVIAEIAGTKGADTLTGTSAAERIFAAGGDDRIEGKGGNDVLAGGSGKDVFAFASGHGHDTVTDFAAGDGLRFASSLFSSADAVRAAFAQTAGGVTLATGSGSSVVFSGASLADMQKALIDVYGDGKTPLPSTPPVAGVPAAPSVPDHAEAGKTFAGTGSADILAGSAGDDTFFGRAGNDKLRGGAGDDILWGNAGNDVLDGGAGDDWLKGGDGKDSYLFSAGHGHDTVHEFRKGDAIILSDELFDGVDDILGHLHQTSKGIMLDTGPNSGILFTDTTMETVQNADWHIAST